MLRIPADALRLLCFAIIFPAIVFGLTPSSVSLTASPNPANYGQAVTLSATVPSGATGKVTFYDGATVLGVGAVSGTQATLTTVMMPSGNRMLRAYYAGDATYGASSSAALPETVVAGTSLGFYWGVGYAATSPATSLAVGDFNGDGKPDFVMAGWPGVSVYLGNGNGTFQTAVNYSLPDAALYVAVGDFNGDGKRRGCQQMGRTLNVRLWSMVGGIWQFHDYTYTAYTVTTATMTSPVNGTTLGSSTVTFQWTLGTSTQNGLWIGSTGVGSANLVGTGGTSTSYTATGLPTDGRTLYVRLWSMVGGIWYFNDYTYAAYTISMATMISPINGSTFSSSTVTFQWNLGISTQNGLWIGGTGAGSSDLAATGGTGTSYTATGLPTDGRTLYVRLWSMVNGYWQFIDYSYTAL